jgi:putative peptide zinc metalloprotease protein
VSTEVHGPATTARRPRAAVFLAALMALVVALGPAPAAGAVQEPSGGDTNQAVAVNTEDGASVFRLAFSVRHVTDGVVDQQNLAYAYASCTECRTVALAFQVVIVVGDASYVAPVNQAVAINEQCTECLTFASATQIVVGVDGPVVLTPEGRRRLAQLRRRMAELESRMGQLTAAELAAEVSSIEQELIAILSVELVPAGVDADDDDDDEDGDDGDGGAATTTTGGPTATTTVTSAPVVTTTTATTEPSTVPSTTVAGG